MAARHTLLGVLLTVVFLALSAGCGDDGAGVTPDSYVPADGGSEGLNFTDTAWPPDTVPYPDWPVTPTDGQPPAPDMPINPSDGPPPPPPDQGPPPPTCTTDGDCNDNMSCTSDKCLSGKCKHTVNANFCAIAGKCIAIATLNPQNGCQKCDPGQDPWVWSNYVCTKLFAGTGQATFLNGTTAQARFYYPMGIAVGPSGEVYVADDYNHRIRMISNGLVTTLAGSGTPGTNDGAAAAARFHRPMGVAVGLKGEVYVADYTYSRIRKIEKGVVSTVAGSNYGFLNGTTAQSLFRHPVDVAVGQSGEIYVADADNHRIRMISGNMVSTLAGSGTAGYLNGAAAAARFNYPTGLDVGPKGAVYVADRNNHRIRKIAGGAVTIVAGTGNAGSTNGSTSVARFYHPSGIDVATDGTIYIGDEYNHRIRRIAGTTVSTLAGSSSGYINSPSLDVRFSHPWGVALSGASTLLVADRHNHRIRRITW
jgi:NHL repeat